MIQQLMIMFSISTQSSMVLDMSSISEDTKLVDDSDEDELELEDDGRSSIIVFNLR